MNEEEKKAFTLSFQNNLDNLVRNKINPTAEAIISAEMPMIYLFEDLMNKIDKQQKEIENIKEYINSPEFLDWNLGFKLIDELEYRKDRINELLEE